MTRTRMMLTFVLLMLTTSSAHASIPLPLWSQSHGNTTTQETYAVATDDQDNVYITGRYAGSMSFGGATLFSDGVTDIFIAKYNSDGVHLWSYSYGSTGIDEGHGIAVDNSGNVYITGTFQYTVDFGGGNLVSNGFVDVVVAKYNSNGQHQWSQHFGNTQTDYGRSIAVDGSGNVIVTGSFQGTVDFGGGNVVSQGNDDIFLAKYDTNGNHQWSQGFGDTSIDRGYSVAVDGSNNIVVTGTFLGTVDFGGGPIVYLSSGEVFLVQFDSNGNHQWSHGFQSTFEDRGYGVATDPSGNVFVTGLFEQTINFGGGDMTSAGADDIFLAKFDVNGVHQWSRSFGDEDDDQGFSVATDASGAVVMTGFFSGAVDFGGGMFLGAGNDDIFLAKFDAEGGHRTSQGFGDTGEDQAWAVAVDDSDAILAVGHFTGMVDFGSGDLTSAGVNDIFIAKYSGVAVDPTITAVSDIGNDQGGQVLIEFDRSAHDDPLSPVIVTDYEAYRRIDPPPAGAVAAVVPAFASDALLFDLGWTYVGSVPAHGASAYSIVAPTIGDSTETNGPYYSVFFVRAATTSPYVFCDSPPDSGYSVDNLAPAVPENVMYVSGNLFWSGSPDEDFNYFTVYGSNSTSFSLPELIGHTTTASMDVSATPYTYYFVTATDFAGNESQPGGLDSPTAVDDTPSRRALFLSNYPNPFHPRTTVSYGVRSRTPISVRVYDAAGKRVVTLVDAEVKDPGEYRVEWTGRDGAGTALPSGVYFLVAEQGDDMRTRKMVLLK